MIEVKNVTKTFEDFTALKDMSCIISDGCIYGIVGSNGAGKSTFLRLLAGVYKPNSGTIIMDGMPVYESPDTKTNMVFIPDELYFPRGYSLKQMAQMYNNCYNSFDFTKFNELVERFKLPLKKSINGFSKGMKRQAAVILALSLKPKYFLFDETFDGLDPVMRNHVKSIICDEILDNKATAIITSHSLRELEGMCDQLALLHKGGLLLESDIDNLKTSLFKIQVALSEDFDKDSFSPLNVLHFSKTGSIANMIIDGDKEETTAIINDMNPAIFDILPLSLEEVFTYKMAEVGYSFEELEEVTKDEE